MKRSSITSTSWKRNTTRIWIAKWWSCRRTKQALLSNWLFRDLHVGGESGVRELYQVALEMERRTRDHFRKLAADLPAGLEKELCGELAAEEEEHVALLEGELEQMG